MLMAACGGQRWSGTGVQPVDDDVVAGGAVEPADWVLRQEPQRSATSLELLVEERACASGRSAEGRIEVDVDESPDAISLSVGVRRLDGDQECPGNPRTPYRVDLSEPVGDRDIRSSQSPSDVENPERTATLTTRGPNVIVVPASDTPAMSPTWVEPQCDSGSNDDGFLPLLDDPAEYRTADMVVAAAVEHYGLPIEGWHVLRLSRPGARDSSWWTQYRDGVAVAQVRVEPRLVGWSGHAAVCAGLGDAWVPDPEPGPLDSFEPRTTAGRLAIDDWLASTDGLRREGSQWTFEDLDDRCAAWVGIESIAADNGATLTFTDWFGQWPDPIDNDGGSVRRDGAMGIALDGRGVMLVSDGDGLIQQDLDDDFVWDDISSPIPCLLEDPILYTIDP